MHPVEEMISLRMIFTAETANAPDGSEICFLVGFFLPPLQMLAGVGSRPDSKRSFLALCCSCIYPGPGHCMTPEASIALFIGQHYNLAGERLNSFCDLPRLPENITAGPDFDPEPADLCAW